MVGYSLNLNNLLMYLAPETSQLTPAQRSGALSLAAPFRIWALPERKADESQCLWAAWQLSLTTSGTGDGSGKTPGKAAMVLRKEGDLQIGYAQNGAAVVSAEAAGNYRLRYDALKYLASRGAIMARIPRVPHGRKPVARFNVNTFNNSTFR